MRRSFGRSGAGNQQAARTEFLSVPSRRTLTLAMATSRRQSSQRGRRANESPTPILMRPCYCGPCGEFSENGAGNWPLRRGALVAAPTAKKNLAVHCTRYCKSYTGSRSEPSVTHTHTQASSQQLMNTAGLAGRPPLPAPPEPADQASHETVWRSAADRNRGSTRSSSSTWRRRL